MSACRLTPLILTAFFICSLLLNPTTGFTAEKSKTPETLMVADFEGKEGLKNNLKGQSGTWNLDSLDANESYADADVVEMEGLDGNKANHALKVSYSVDNPLAQNGFWTKLMALDARPYDQLAFDVKGDKEKGFTDRFKIEVKKFKETGSSETIKGAYDISVTGEWKTFSIPLNRLTGLINFSDPRAWEDPAIARKGLDEFVMAFKGRHVTAPKGTLYIDNIRFVNTGNPGSTAVDFPKREIDKTSKKMSHLEFETFLMKRLGGFPKQMVVKKEFSKDDKEFLREIAKDTWRFFEEMTDQEHGLPLDTILLGKTKPFDEGVWIGDYTSVTNVGVYLMCIVSAYDLGFITKEDAVKRITHTLATVEKMPFHVSGFPYNYYDTTTLEKTSYFVSFVDSGWWISGLYVAKNAFPEVLSTQADRLLHRGDFSFFYDPVEQQMFHGYYENLQVYSDYHYGVFYTEPRVATYMAVARGEAPEEHWFSLVRTFPEEYGWQQQQPEARVERTTLGHKYFGGYYQWKDLKYVPSWGGSAFEALMPAMVLKEKELAPEGLGLNDKNHALGQVRYAKEELKYPVWGMSPSSVPEGGYSEFGAAPFGSKGYKSGVVTPHASVLALEFVPEEVIANLRALLENYDLYGEYGFYDSVTVETGLVARKYLALDQGMILVAINNYLNDGAIRKRFHADPEMKKGEKLLTEEKFFDEPKAKTQT